MSIEWGPEIPVNGVRPVWLADDDDCRPRWGKDTWFSGDWVKARHVDRWDLVELLCLPADHWAHPVIAQGFEPWAGGDEAPEDWDGGATLRASGEVAETFVTSVAWQADDPHLLGGEGRRVIGYKKRTKPAEQPEDDGDYVRVKRMTAEELRDNWREWDDEIGFIWLAKKYGFFKEDEPTPLDRFTRDNPNWRDKSVEDAVKLALEWRE